MEPGIETAGASGVKEAGSLSNLSSLDSMDGLDRLDSLGSLRTLFREMYQLEQQDIRSYSPLTLAYIGDAVYELIIRSYTAGKGNAPVEKLHHETSSLVKAHSQSDLVCAIDGELDEEERSVYKRGRNAHSYTRAKNATVSDYRRATGLEALIGYLFLQGRYERMLQLIYKGLQSLGVFREENR